MPTLTFPVTTGETYYVAVDGKDGSFGDISVSCADLGGGDLPLPDGALGMLDFMHGVYKWGEDTYTADEVIDTPSAVVPGLGLWVQDYQVVDPFDNLPAIGILAGDFLNHLLLGDFTIVSETFSNYYAVPVYIDGTHVLGYEAQSNSQLLVYDYSADLRQIAKVETVGFGVPEYNIHALTRTTSHLALRVSEGEFAGTTWEDGATATASFTATAAYIGGGPGSNGAYGAMLCTRMVFYPAQDNGDLAGLIADPLLTAPANDDFADAIAITLGQTLTGHNFLATDEVGEPNHGSAGGACSVWWKYVAAASGDVTVDITSPGDFGGNGAVVAVYTGASVGALSEVDSASDWPRASLTFSATSGTTYHIAVDGAGGGNGPITITLSAA